MSYGFAEAGFEVTGVDIAEDAGIAYREFTGGSFVRADLSEYDPDCNFDVVVGSPPCRPWSPLNVSKRGDRHSDYLFPLRFAEIVARLKPKAFVLENVPAMAGDRETAETLGLLGSAGYKLARGTVYRYSDFGAATSRKRFVAAGFRNWEAAIAFEEEMKSAMSPGLTVGDAAMKYRYMEKGGEPDHVWPEFRTIMKYRQKYMEGKYGWRKLEWALPAPSFGNVMKTYTLHPDSDLATGSNLRVISVLEAARIMGIDHGFMFPEGIPVGRRYQMIADSVSPVFSAKLANSLKRAVER